MINQNIGFKLIAIRPLVGCLERFSKNLRLGMIYKFYDDYKFVNLRGDEVGIKEGDETDVTDVYYTNTVPNDLYTISVKDGHEIHLNISAIVGKNGSGKSTLLELLYLGCYAASVKFGLINDDEYNVKRFKETGDSFFSDIVSDVQETIDELKVDYYFSKGDSLYVLKNTKPYCYLSRLSNGLWVEESFEIGELFYSIVINYSIYGLNSGLNNSWLNALFHKNDGYKTPIVINPYRRNGNIDINSEYHLAQTRLLSNLITDSISNNNIISNKSVVHLEFDILPDELETFNSISFKNIFSTHEAVNNETIIDLFVRLLHDLVKYNVPEQDKKNLETYLNNDIALSEIHKFDYKESSPSPKYIEILYLALKYTIKKIFKICRNYEDFSDFTTNNGRDKVPKLQNVNELIIALNSDKSHITLKLKQILYTIKAGYFKSDWHVIRNPKNIAHKAYRHSITINDFAQMIKDARRKNSKVDMKELIPVAFFRPNLLIQNSNNPESISNFGSLSSGEQQLIHSIQSILYHINNVNSVFYSSKPYKTTYSSINIILDEVELYYHPEFQRIFLDELIAGIKSLSIKNIEGINILFSTHSPFILSDIPRQNILKLVDGIPLVLEQGEKTFGANIHELLAHEFFMTGGFVGKYSKDKILDLVKFLKYDSDEQVTVTNLKPTYKWDKEHAQLFINLIAETLIAERLQALYDKKYHARDKAYIEEQIKKLQAKLQNFENEEDIY